MTAAGHPPFLRGERCGLRPLTPADVDGPWPGWFNDPDVTRFMLHGDLPSTKESTLAFYEHVITSSNDLVLAIDIPDLGHVGNIGLHRIDWRHRTAEYGVVIGEAAARGRGVGREATQLICDHGFRRLGLHRIWLGCLAEHEAARRMYRSVGFREEGVLREVFWHDGQRVDQVIMGLLAGELAAAS